jgi:hypothetical protein
MSVSTSIERQLCLVCGLCCDGALFKDVELRPGDDAARLRTLGLPLAALRGQTRFAQPCAALGADCRCRIYADRPARCREFECALLHAVSAGHVELAAALRSIRAARQRADRVRELLRELGDREEHAALSVRFRRMTKRFEAGSPDEVAAGRYSQLTLAMHDLNLLLREKFYPDPAD